MSERSKPIAGRPFADYHGYVPFDTLTVIEKERVPVLYDPSGKPLTRSKRVGFDPNRR